LLRQKIIAEHQQLLGTEAGQCKCDASNSSKYLTDDNDSLLIDTGSYSVVLNKVIDDRESATLVCTVSVTPMWKDSRSPDAGGKLSVTAVRYQLTDTGSSIEGDGRKGVCYQLVAAAAATDSPTPNSPTHTVLCL